ncbi:hypothetical protein FIBSPDRAFT_870344 [Athelia psychrophila]|uniref:F-box domain-containing protein n=1 Tax=Athelia psychrophila TaxID=1759441 RepID=A0A166B5E7_9AGAM|nr:hypothetical protein FIBSPDRAFT_870344 [Fibularhizoctonia sp. CBS 109695]
MGRKQYPPPREPSAPGPSNQPRDVEEEDKARKIQELQLTVYKLEEELDSLREKLRVSEARVHALQNPHAKRAVNLPDELLRLIFLRAIPPTAFLDTSPSRPYPSPYSHAIATKKAIVLTCAQWARVGTERLYGTIVLMHLGPLIALARTLALRPALGHLVQSIHIRCALFEGHMPLYLRELRAVFATCPRLEHVAHCGLLPHWEVETAAELVARNGADAAVHHGAMLDSLQLLPRGLRRLDIAGGVWLACFEAVAGEFPALEELNIILHTCAPGHQPLHPVRLPHLTALRVSTDRRTLATLEYLALAWHTPALTHLRLDFHTGPRYVDAFLSAPSRSGLKYLHVHACCESIPPDKLPLHFLPGACPALTHLVLSAGAELPETPHPTVRHLDIWTPKFAGPSPPWGPDEDGSATNSAFESQVQIRADAPRAFPALCTVRTLDRTLTDAADWPRLFPPTLLPAGAVEYAFRGFQVRVADDAITRVDVQLDEDEDSGSDYETESDLSDPQSDELWSEGEGGKEDPEEIFSGTREVMGVEEVLTIWERTREREEDALQYVTPR